MGVKQITGNKAYPFLSAESFPITYSEINSRSENPHDQTLHITAHAAHDSS